MENRFRTLVLCLIVASGVPNPAWAGARIKDIIDIEGARSNQLVGFGLVVGLDNTGGRSQFTQQVAVDMLARFKIASRINSADRADNVYRSGTVSAVMVTADLGPFARHGSRIDVIISVIDDAISLQGGTLILTPLKGADGVDYAVAQGPVSVGGFLFGVPSGSAQPLASAQKNHPSVGRIPGGATVEREARGNILCNGQLRLLLRQPDYVTANNIAFVINKRYPDAAITLDAGSVQVIVPPAFLPKDLVWFVGEIGLLEVTTDVEARVVINERTGTIVAGEDVKVSTVAVAHANLAILTTNEPVVSQPAPFSRGTTTVVPRPGVGITEQTGTLKVIEHTVTVAELARALNALGVTPRDLIAILQALKQAGALHAELVVI
ncbi:MAG TPA: flagellar basal body P-ring protein FlgI [Gemmataceae bacterium]|nr:flagellar basal body P-ring protein FlgI [Gemmataceae bacterium]